MCGFSLVIQLSLEQKMELESIFDSQIHCRLNSAQSSTTQDSCMGTLGP
jgi:hypothetical protein